MGPHQQPLNGRTGELVRYLIGLGLAAVVAYFTAIGQLRESQTETNGKLSVIDQREQSHFEEVQRSLIRIERFMERIEANGQDRRTGEPYSVQRGQQP